MNLETFLKFKGITQKEFAASINITPSAIQNYLMGRRKPSGEIAAKIEVATEGKVTIHDLIDHWKQKNS